MIEQTFFGLSDASMVIWLRAMGLWTIIQAMVNAPSKLSIPLALTPDFQAVPYFAKQFFGETP